MDFEKFWDIKNKFFKLGKYELYIHVTVYTYMHIDQRANLALFFMWIILVKLLQISSFSTEQYGICLIGGK